MPVVDVDAALRRVDEFFMEQGPVHKTLRDLARRLPEAGVSYAVIGGMALNLHGYERVTTDVDLIMTREGLDRFVANLVGVGYVPAHPGARKHFKHAETGVRVEVIVTGEYPGDGMPKDISFPDPDDVAIDLDGVRVVNLQTLIELKLASGLSAAHRIQDLADVQRLIEHLDLPVGLAEDLPPSVQAEYLRLWKVTAAAKRGNGPDRD